MQQITLGRTGLKISHTGFGALPIQRINFEASSQILNRALDAGITFVDTARAYSDSEEKIGCAISHRRGQFILATKTGAKNTADFNSDLEASLKLLNTNHIDIYQFHNPSFVPMPGGEDGLYDAALEARAAGKIRYIGITQHSIDNAFAAVESGLFDTLQYPFNHLATEREIELVELCRTKNIGFIAMKALSGGLVTNASLPFAWLWRFENVVPIWGIQRMTELEEIIALSNNPPALTEDLRAAIQKDRRELVGAFCRGCGYCLPCPAGIPIQNANRMRQLLERSPYQRWITPARQSDMEKIADCTHCGACSQKCPYGLKPFETLPGQLQFYREFVQSHLEK